MASLNSLGTRRGATRSSLAVGLVFFLAAPSSLEAQDDSARIWGTVQTTEGQRYEGFIRWDRNEANWVDVLDGSRERSEEAYQAWVDAVRGGQRPVRTLDLEGYRISWNEDDPDFPELSTSGIRFGHLRALTVLGRDRASLTLKSGQVLEFSRGSSDIGTTMRELLVETAEGDLHELEWEELERVDFSAAPLRARARSPRLYGTVRDRQGRAFSGYLAWDLDEVLLTDVLDGNDDEGRDQKVPFADIAAIERGAGSARVTLTSGEVMVLSGSNDVGSGHRGVQISDPYVGMIEVEWDDFERVDFHPADKPASYALFDGGRHLLGTVVTVRGDSIRGWIRWDADEERSWELLNGVSDGVGFAVEFGRIARIVKDGAFGSVVTLRVDGVPESPGGWTTAGLDDDRVLTLEDSNDVDGDNKGIFIQPLPEPLGESPAEHPDSAASADLAIPVGGTDSTFVADLAIPIRPSDAEWRYVSWSDFSEVRFEWPRQIRLERVEGTG